MPGIVSQILTNCGIERCKRSDINVGTVNYSDILHIRMGFVDFLTGENCLFEFRQLGKQPFLAVGWRGAFHRPVGTKLPLG